MDYSFSIQHNPRVAHLWFSGILSTRTLTDACADLIRSPEWEPGTPMIWDFSGVRRVDLCPGSLASLVQTSARSQRRIGTSASAAIVQNEEIDALMEGYANELGAPDRLFFKSKSRWEAVTWLFAPGAVSLN